MRITIVGAGFSGSALAIELARNAPGGTEIRLIGMPESFGRGVAYGEARAEHLLNVRANELGIDPDDPGGFAAWLNLGARGENRFMPRLAYGEYLYARLQDAIQETRADFRMTPQEAIAVERHGDGFRITLIDGREVESDIVVLAVGALPPQPLHGVGPRLLVDPAYIGWPWQRSLLGDEAIDRIAPDARVLIVGTGLTMADTVATLQRRRHRGPIVALSRHGLLPQAHAQPPSAPVALPPTVLQALNSGNVRQLLRALRTLMPILPDWRSLIDALRPYLQAYWKTLAHAQRARFLRHLRSHWESVRHRLAPDMHAELQALRDEGRLRIRAGRLLRARLGENGGAEVLIRERGATHATLEHYDVVVRATGLDTDIEHTTHPLVSQLRDAGLICADALGLGLRASPQCEVLDRHGMPVRGLYCAGPLLRGQLWEITAVQELRIAARNLGRQLLRNAQATSPAAVARQG
ncbi:MAG: FAD/NAD(P)-binding protein [Thermomonas sp.]|uniref:FAD/NAD(P)-binding protein n=1 Tax=Thermomonas sp. TaxID=1971895 RepID=UPI0039E284A8